MILFAARAARTPPIDTVAITLPEGKGRQKAKQKTQLNKPELPRTSISYPGTPLAAPGPQPSVKARAYTKLFIKTTFQKVYIQSTTP